MFPTFIASIQGILTMFPQSHDFTKYLVKLVKVKNCVKSSFILKYVERHKLFSRNIWSKVSLSHTGNYGNLLSRIFDKNFVKATFLLKKLLKNWFHGKKFRWERISRFSTLWLLNMRLVKALISRNFLLQRYLWK